MSRCFQLIILLWPSLKCFDVHHKGLTRQKTNTKLDNKLLVIQQLTSKRHIFAPKTKAHQNIETILHILLLSFSLIATTFAVYIVKVV